MKIVINNCYGGFGLSPKALLWLYERGFDIPGFKTEASKYYNDERSLNKALWRWREYLKDSEKEPLLLGVFTPDEKFHLYLDHCYEHRNHPLLIECVETLGEESFGAYASLKIVEIPDDVNWEIQEYDGMEHVAEVHRIWG